MKNIRIQELEERLELKGWGGSSNDEPTCIACGKDENADHSNCDCGGSGGDGDITIGINTGESGSGIGTGGGN